MKRLTRPISGSTRNGKRPARFYYWRTGYGTPLPYEMAFWVQQAGEYHSRPRHVTGDYEYRPGSIHFFYQTAGSAILELGNQARPVEVGDLLILPAGRRFSYRAKAGINYHWFVLEGSWPAYIAGPRPWLSVGDDAEISSKFVELREVLILRPPGFALLAISLVFALRARLANLAEETPEPSSGYPEPVRNALVFLRDQYDLPFDAARTAGAAGVSPSYLRALFEKWVGESPQQYHTGYRMLEARRLLTEKTLSIGEVAFQVGFTDVRYFSRVFKQQTGYTPSQYAETYGRGSRKRGPT